MPTIHEILRMIIPVIFGTAWLTGCADTRSFPPEESYAALARQNRREPNPVIVIPGILGSKLVDDASGRVVWGSFGTDAIHHRSAAGRRALALPMRKGASLTSLTDDVRVDGTLGRLSLAPGLGVNAYARLLKALAIGGYRPENKGGTDAGEHLTCFEFGYDWRKSNATNAAALDDFIHEKTRLIQADSLRRHGVRKEVKFDIVAHSMGGLLARYYLMYGRQPLRTDGLHPQVTWAGAKHVKRLIQVGSPNGGSVQAIQQMRNGMALNPLLPKFQSAVIGTFPSVYELLPRSIDRPLVDGSGKFIDPFDATVWEKFGWGLADPAQDRYLQQLLPNIANPAERRIIALDHQRKALDSAKAFQAALDCRCHLPAGVEMHTFYGDAVETDFRYQVDSFGRITAISKLPGDGTVIRRSAMLSAPDGGPGPIPWTSRHAIHASHMTLPVRPEFIHSLLPLLLNLPESHTQP